MMEILVSLLTLLFLEIVLGIDNLIFVSIAASHLPAKQQPVARNFGLILALVTRLALLACINWIASFTHPLFAIDDFAVSGRDLILGIGGLFLLVKGTLEIHAEFDMLSQTSPKKRKIAQTFLSVILQIAFLDIVFSLDSVITAVGMTSEFWIMATAIVLAILFMLYANHPLSRFIEKNPTIKMLAMSFILMIGMVLIADSLHYHVPRGYIYFSIGFSLFVETLNSLLRNRGAKKA
jgi:predicted tellurium resistance membrane protein TerC